MAHVLLVNFKTSDVAGELPYLCKQAGLDVSVFCSKDSWLLKNSFWDHHVFAPTHDYDAFCVALELEIARTHYDWVCLVDEKTLWICNEHVSNDDVRSKIFPTTDPTMYEILGSKCGLARIAEEKNILQPDFFVTSLDVKKILTAPIPFPFLIKFDKGGGGDQVFYCDSSRDVIAICDTHKTYSGAVVVQSFISGDVVSVELFSCKGFLRSYTSSYVVKTINGPFSVALLRNYFFDPHLRHVLEDVCQKLSCDGLGSLTFIKKDNQYFLIEADLRANVWFGTGKKVGVDFSRAIASRFNNSEFTIEESVLLGNHEKMISHFGRALLYIFKNKDVDLFQKIFIKRSISVLIPWHDKKFFYATCVDVLRGYLFYSNLLPYWHKIKKLITHR